jgi:hypothetical protein
VQQELALVGVDDVQVRLEHRAILVAQALEDHVLLQLQADDVAFGMAAQRRHGGARIPAILTAVNGGWRGRQS